MYLLSDMCFRIKSAIKKKSENVIILNSKFCSRSLITIYSLGYISGLKILSFKFLKVLLRYQADHECALRVLVVLSKKHFKTYVTLNSIKKTIFKNRFLSLGFLLCSTSYKNRIFTDVECCLLRIAGIGMLFVS